MAATSLRRNTFVLQDPSFPTPPPGPSTGMDRQNIMRLKVNRIALIQELRVEHIIGPLFHAGVLVERDLKQISSGRTHPDKARILVDLLPEKPKETEWYKHFRESLLNPDSSSDTKRRYRLLVEFLDNTVIHRPTSQASRFRDSSVTKKHSRLPPVPGVTDKHGMNKLQAYPSLPDINNKQGKGEGPRKSHRRTSETDVTTDMEDGMSYLSMDSHRTMTLVKGFFHQWLPTPDNFRSLIEIDKKHWDKLVRSDNPEDHRLMGREEVALINLRRVEVIAALARRKQLPSGFELCMCDAVQILTRSELQHLYMKHLLTLEANDVNLVHDICASYDTVLQMLDSSAMTEIVNQVIQTGLRMADFLIAVNKLSDADHVLSSTVHFLKENPELDSWVPRYQAYTKLMMARNMACQPDKAQNAYFDAVQMQYQISMMSFGQTIVHEGALHSETSHMLLEYGSIISAHGWSRRALAEIDPDDHAAVVRALVVGVSAHCAHWQAAKAESMAVYAVQYARDKFGERHPMYVEALLSFCHFSNEFKQDEFGLKVATDLLDVVDKTYGGCDTIQLALAHRAVSKARMCANMFDNDKYYTHAMEAVRIARSILGSHAPLLHVFLHTFASALQWKALHCPKEVYDSTLRWAEAEAKQALTLVSATFGEISLKSSSMLLLLGQIYLKMNSHPDIEENLQDVAERHLYQAVEYLKLCQPPSSNFLLLAMAALATFYKIVNKTEQAVPLFRYITDHVESTGWYLKWVHTCFNSLAALYTTQDVTQEVDNVHVKLSHWLKANPGKTPPLEESVLKESPVEWKAFVAKSDLWMSALQKIITVESTPGISVVQGQVMEGDASPTDSNCE